MNKRERVLRTIEGKEVDRMPVLFSLHFNDDEKHGLKAEKAHLDFLEETDVDILKVMNENLMPSFYNIKHTDDWRKVLKLSFEDDFMKKQVELVKRLVENKKEKIFTLGTIHGVMASILHTIEEEYGYEKGREFLYEQMKVKNPYLLEAVRHVSGLIEQLVEEYLNIGVDGIYYAGLGEEHYLDDKVFRDYIEPFEKSILKKIKSMGGYTFYHICKDNVNLDRYKVYEDYIDVINWEVHDNDIPLTYGKEVFPKATLLGGIDKKSELFYNGSVSKTLEAIQRASEQFNQELFILGADCTLPTDINRDKIKQIVNCLDSLKRN